MNTSTQRDTLLDDHVTAARALVDEDALAEAVASFRADLPQVRPQRLRVPVWLRVAGATAMLVLAVGLAPLWLPGKPGGHAFADAQAWFEHFRTLHFIMVSRQEERVLSTIEVWADERGAARVEVPPVVHIVAPAARTLYTVLPGGRVMSQHLGAAAGISDLGGGMDWLDDLRSFKGKAEPLSGTRNVDDTEARGWRLSLSGNRFTLWVAAADDRPLLLEAELAGGVTLEARFHFDVPLPEDLFVVPAKPVVSD